MVEQHNHYRELHGMDSLLLNEELAKSSYEWEIYMNENNVMEHSDTGGNYGENKAWRSPPGPIETTGMAVDI